MNIQVHDRVSAQLAGMAERMRDRTAANKVMAYAGMVAVKSWCRDLASRNRNRFGVRSSFWDRMRNAVHIAVNAVCGTVVMAAEHGHRYYGGTVRPRLGVDHIAIPLTASAYGRRPREFSDLELTFRRSKATGELLMFLAQPVSRGVGVGPKGKAGARLLYLLKPEVTHGGDKTVLPPDADLEAAAEKALERYLVGGVTLPPATA
jgi:hypothetical protein